MKNKLFAFVILMFLASLCLSSCARRARVVVIEKQFFQWPYEPEFLDKKGIGLRGKVKNIGGRDARRVTIFVVMKNAQLRDDFEARIRNLRRSEERKESLRRGAEDILQGDHFIMTFPVADYLPAGDSEDFQQSFIFPSAAGRYSLVLCVIARIGSGDYSLEVKWD